MKTLAGESAEAKEVEDEAAENEDDGSPIRLAECLRELQNRKFHKDIVIIYAAAAGMKIKDVVSYTLKRVSDPEFQAAGQEFADFCFRHANVSLNRSITEYLGGFDDPCLSDAPAFPSAKSATEGIQVRTAERGLAAAWRSCRVRPFTYGKIRQLAELALVSMRGPDAAVQAQIGRLNPRDSRVHDVLGRVAGYFERFFPNSADRDDAFQEAALHLLAAEQTRRVPLNPDQDWRLARRIAQRLRQTWGQEQGARREMPYGDGVKWITSEGERVVRRQREKRDELKEILDYAIRRLPDDQQEIVKLHYGIDGRDSNSILNIIEILKLNKYVARKKLNRALSDLREYFTSKVS